MNPLSGIQGNDGDVMVYNATTGQWEPQALSSGGVGNIAKLVKTANQTITSGTTPTDVTWDIEDLDTGNNFISPNYTVPSNGYYFVSFRIVCGGLGTSDWVEIGLYKNGSIVDSVGQPRPDNAGGTEVRESHSTIISANASDTLKIAVSSSDLNFVVHGGSRDRYASYLTIAKLG